MIARTKIDVHAKTLLMEFRHNVHPTKDYSIFRTDIIDELVEKYMQIGTSSADFYNFEVESNYRNKKEAEIDSNILDEAEFDSNKIKEAETNSNNLKEAKIDSGSKPEARSDSGTLESKQAEAESDFGQVSLHSDNVGQSTLTSANQFSPPHSPPTELKLLPDHLKYAYLDDHQHFLETIANNLN
ncbi:hypothetical protein CR513_20116, partial [Mucuna pruriens]